MNQAGEVCALILRGDTSHTKVNPLMVYQKKKKKGALGENLAGVERACPGQGEVAIS